MLPAEMTLKKISSLILLVILAGTACKKQSLPPSSEGPPVFSFDGVIGKDSVKIFAGKDDYYLHTYSTVDSLNIHSFSGEFRKNSCAGCPGTLSVSLRDYKMRMEKSIPDIEKSLHPGPYKFYSHADSVIAYRFSADTLFPGKNGFQWDLGDGSNTDLSGFTYIFSPNSTSQPKVCLNTISPSGCTAGICNIINANAAGGCHAFFKVKPSSGTMSVQFFAPAMGTNAAYSWEFGDSSTSPASSPMHNYTKPGVYKVCLTVTANNGSCKSTFCKMVVVGNPPNQCGSGYSVNVVKVPANFNSATIRWAGANGAWYNSAPPKGKQPPPSVFEIISVEDYQPNTAGHKTKKITAKINAFLYNESNPMDSLLINSGKFVFAAAYP
jgi:PKD repeat protein